MRCRVSMRLLLPGGRGTKPGRWSRRSRQKACGSRHGERGEPRHFPTAGGQGDRLNPWHLVYDGYDPAQERLREALTTLGNGFFATRGAWPEARAGEVHYPGTYVAGCYDRRVSCVAGVAVENEDLVNLPNWLPVNFRAEDGDWFDPEHGDIL